MSTMVTIPAFPTNYSAWVTTDFFNTNQNQTTSVDIDFDFGQGTQSPFVVQLTYFYDGVRVIREDTLSGADTLTALVGGSEASLNTISFRVQSVSVPIQVTASTLSLNLNAPSSVSGDADLYTDFEFINSTLGNDILNYATETDQQMIFTYDGNDSVVSGSGDDIIYGFDGDDTLNGGDGNDKIYGGSDDDTLISGGGNVDLLDGGTGDDHYVIDANTTNATIIDNDGEVNTLRLHGISLSDDVEAIRAADDLLLSFTDSTGDLRNIVLRDSFSGSTLQTSVDNIVLDDGTFNIATFISTNGTEFETTGTDTINGGFAYLNDGWDTHNGSASNDFLSGGSGEDTLRGQGGNDLIYGGDDKDYLFGNDGNDRIYGGDGQDEIRGNDGNDSLYGNDGKYRI